MAYLMIVDDDSDFTDAALIVLQQQGYEVDICSDPSLAMDRMKLRCPDLVIMDVMFPQNKQAGFELARAVRQSAGTLQTIPILMLTGINNEFHLGFSVKDIDEKWLPVSDFLEKPVDIGILKSKVRVLLKERGSNYPTSANGGVART